MEQCKGLSTPVCKDEVIVAGSTALTDIEATRFRRGAARINYMAQDRPDLSVASRILSQGMSSPTVNDEVRLKRVIRYLKSSPQMFEFYGLAVGLTDVVTFG